MPLRIIRHDLTQVEADIIVNTANPEPVVGSGTDYAIYCAAGMDEVLKERQAIGTIARGEVAYTHAYNLKARYIIHTVGPCWIDGMHDELTILESCYKNALYKAKELNCHSIAFPLISTGVYGFPKDKALHIALNVMSAFLLQHDMDIILVVFDKNSYQLSSKVMGEIDTYIDAHYVEKQKKHEYASTSSIYGRGEQADEIERRREVKQTTLEDELKALGPTFKQKLLEYMALKNLDNTAVWKGANLDRKHFSKMLCVEDYHPSKKAVIALCIGLKLDLSQAIDLLASAGWALNPSSKMDLIVKKFIEDQQYNIIEVNMALFKYTNDTLC